MLKIVSNEDWEVLKKYLSSGGEVVLVKADVFNDLIDGAKASAENVAANYFSGGYSGTSVELVGEGRHYFVSLCQDAAEEASN